MQRTRLLLMLVLPALAAGLWMFLRSQAGGDLVPVTPVAPAAPRSTPVEGAAAGGPAAAVGATATRRHDAPDRTDGSTPRPAPDERVAEVEITVVCAEPTGDVALADVEVSLLCRLRSPVAGSPGAGSQVAGSLGAGSPGAGERPLGARSARTDARGIARFDVPGGDGAEAIVACSIGAHEDLHLSAAAVTRAKLSIVPRVRVEGSVVDAGGRGIADADLVLLPWNDPTCEPPQTRLVGRSRADGSFSLALGAGGRVGAQHADYSPSPMYFVRPELDGSRPVPTIALELSLLTTQAAIEGQVTDAQGLAVAGAELEFRSAGSPPRDADLAAPPQRARAAADGHFAVRNLLPGRVNWAVRCAGHGSAKGVCELAAGQQLLLPVQLLPPCEVAGTVVQPDGSPAAGAEVWSGTAGSFESRRTVASKLGEYRLGDLPPGPIDLSARGAQAKQTAGARASTRLELGPGVVEQWNAVLETRARVPRLTGEVLDGNGAGLVAWRVVLTPVRGGRTSAATNEDGRFEVPLAGSGPFDVRVYAPKQSLSTFARAVRTGVDPGSALRIVVDAGRGATLRGIVETEDREPVPAEIFCWHQERREYARYQANPDGRFAIEGVPSGCIDLEFKHPGHATSMRGDVRVEADGDVDLGMVALGAASILHGQVVGPDGRPPEELEVSIRTADGRLVADYSAGTYRFDAVPPGQHVLQVQGRGVAAWSWTVQTEANVDLQQDLQLLAGVPRPVLVTAPSDAGPVVWLGVRSRAGGGMQWLASERLEAAPGNDELQARFEVFMAPGSYEVLAWTRDFEARDTATFADGDAGDVTLRLRHK